MNCPFCGSYPYECVDVGLGAPGVPVAVNCCYYGPFLFDHRTPVRLQRAARRLVEEREFGLPDKRRVRRFMRSLHGKSIRQFRIAP